MPSPSPSGRPRFKAPQRAAQALDPLRDRLLQLRQEEALSRRYHLIFESLHDHLAAWSTAASFVQALKEKLSLLALANKTTAHSLPSPGISWHELGSPKFRWALGSFIRELVTERASPAAIQLPPGVADEICRVLDCSGFRPAIASKQREASEKLTSGTLPTRALPANSEPEESGNHAPQTSYPVKDGDSACSSSNADFTPAKADPQSLPITPTTAQTIEPPLPALDSLTPSLEATPIDVMPANNNPASASIVTKEQRATPEIAALAPPAQPPAQPPACGQIPNGQPLESLRPPQPLIESNVPTSPLKSRSASTPKLPPASDKSVAKKSGAPLERRHSTRKDWPPTRPNPWSNEAKQIEPSPDRTPLASPEIPRPQTKNGSGNTFAPRFELTARIVPPHLRTGFLAVLREPTVTKTKLVLEILNQLTAENGDQMIRFSRDHLFFLTAQLLPTILSPEFVRQDSERGQNVRAAVEAIRLFAPNQDFRIPPEIEQYVPPAATSRRR